MPADPEWGSYAKYERTQPQRKTVEQEDASNAQYAFLESRNIKFWEREKQTNPAWRVHMLAALMARYNATVDIHWQLQEERMAFVKEAVRNAMRELSPVLAAKDYWCRWFTSYYGGIDALHKLEERGKASPAEGGMT